MARIVRSKNHKAVYKYSQTNPATFRPMSSAVTPPSPPSRWLELWSHLLPREGRVLDLACGSGRHTRYLLAQGLNVTAIDRDPVALTAVKKLADEMPLAAGQLEVLSGELEQATWPLQGQSFQGVVVTNYLWRPRFATLLDNLAPGGVLIYETFAAGNETVGKPSNPDFLLQTGELLRLCADLRIVAFQEVFLEHPERFVQRIVAVKKPLSLECQPTLNYRFRLRT
jgi:SAM-dependent methyltransferase